MSKKLIVPVVASAMIGAAGLGLIKSSEGLRTTAYADPVGIPTVCYGHTGREVRVGQRIALGFCEDLLLYDIAQHQAVLVAGSPGNCIRNVPLSQNQLDALTSLTFNIGTAKFCSSTLAHKLGAKDYRGASLEFTKWTKATSNGKVIVLPGLIKRRTAEKALFLTPSTGAVPNIADGPLRTISSIPS